MRLDCKLWVKVAISLFAVMAFAAPLWSQVDQRLVKEILGQEIVSHDVTIHELREYILGRVAKPPVATSANAWTTQSGEIRDRLLNEVVFHGWPREWVSSPAKFQETGVIEANGYRIRKLRYEIMPGFESVALLYEPENLQGKMPAVLVAHGHVGAQGKSVEYKQKQCINLALHGILALNLEWLGYGELGQNEYSHMWAGHLDLVGMNELGLFYLQMRKGLDYLYDHPNVDRARIGMTGLSGGGWQTIILSALDERVKVSVPVAGFSSLSSRIEARQFGDIGDQEQLATDLLAQIDYPHLVALLAPRPTLLIYNAEDDCCFRAPLVKPLVFDAIEPIFKLYGAEQSFTWHENRDPGTHNYQLDNRLAAYRFFSQNFHIPLIENEIPVDEQIKSFEELTVGLPANNLTMLGLARNVAESIKRPPIDASDPAWTSSQRTQLSAVVRYRPAHLTRPWGVGSTKDKGVESKSYEFDMENGLSATGVLFKTISAPDVGPATIVLNDAGIKESLTAVSERMDRGEHVLAADLTFTGDWWQKTRDQGLEQYLYATGDRAIGLEAAQLIELAQWLRGASGQEKIRLETTGIRMQTIGLIAAALKPNLFSAVVVRDGMPSLSYLLDKPVAYNDAPDLFCLDLFKDFDLDRLAAIAQPTEVRYEQDPVR